MTTKTVNIKLLRAESPIRTVRLTITNEIEELRNENAALQEQLRTAHARIAELERELETRRKEEAHG
jgi:FtsZ-binding cell division protein ZapB